MQSNVECLAASGLLGAMWEELLLAQGACWGRARSYSMSPLIREGDQVLVEAVAPEHIRFGDIVVFRGPGGYVIHRVVGRRWRGGCLYLREKGDANLQASLIAVDRVIGRVRAVRRGERTMELVAGSGRALQWVLALNSRAGLALWVLFERVLSHMGRQRGRAALVSACRKLCSVAPAILLGRFDIQ